MNIEIKNIRFSELSSQETHCFNATVYVDGERSFQVKNDGHGGCDSYFPLPNKNNNSEVHSIVKGINAELGKHEVKVGSGDMTISNCLEIVVGELMNKWLEMREVKKILKKICYVQDGALYSLAAKHKPTDYNIEQVKKSTWFKSDMTILNTLPTDEVLKHYRSLAR